MPMVTALTSGTEAGSDLAALLAKPGELTEDEVARAASLVEAAGGKERTEAIADSALASAFESLEQAEMPDDVRAEFAAIAEFITARQW
jgi:geranylgeranyl diphosphate synthase, type I